MSFDDQRLVHVKINVCSEAIRLIPFIQHFTQIWFPPQKSIYKKEVAAC